MTYPLRREIFIRSQPAKQGVKEPARVQQQLAFPFMCLDVHHDLVFVSTHGVHRLECARCGTRL